MGKQSSPRSEGVPIEKYRKTIGKQQEMWASNKSIKNHYRRKHDSLSKDEPGTSTSSSAKKSSKKSKQVAQSTASYIWTGRVMAVLVLVSVMILVYYYFRFVNSGLPN